MNGIPSTFADLGDYPMPLYDADIQAIDGIPENARKLEALLEFIPGFSSPAPNTTRPSPPC